MTPRQPLHRTAAVALATVALVVGTAASAPAQETGGKIAPEPTPLPAPAVSPEELQPVELDYQSTITLGQGSTLTVASTREIGPANLGGRAAWRVATTTLGAAHGGTDVFYLDPTTLRPFHRTVEQAGRTLDIAYEDGWVRGYEDRVEAKKPIAVAVPGAVFGDGGALDALLVSLPLAEGYHTSFDAFDLGSRSSRRWDLKVSGTADLELPAGSFTAFVVKVTPEDGAPGGGTYWVSRTRPRIVVESRTTLPPGQGGSEVLTVLQSWELTSEAAPRPE